MVGLSQKRRILEKDHSSRLSGFLLGIFQSPHIKSRFLSELEAIRLSGASTERALIVAFYLREFVGEPVQEHVLSELIGQDAVSLFERAKSSGTFISYRPRTKALMFCLALMRERLSSNFSCQKPSQIRLLIP